MDPSHPTRSHPHLPAGARLLALVVSIALVAACGPREPAGGDGGADGAATAEQAAGPTIAGSYRLVSRDHPDGTTMTPPEIFGFLTFVDGHRNFHVYWEGEEGARNSLAKVARYSLSDTAYTETSLYFVASEAEGTTYDLSETSGSATVAVEGGEISFELPLHGEPRVVFTADGLTATREGEFVDHWEKVP